MISFFESVQVLGLARQPNICTVLIVPPHYPHTRVQEIKALRNGNLAYPNYVSCLLPH